MSKILYKKEGSVAFISMNRPEALNALSKEIIDELEKVIDEIAADESVKVVVIGGTENFAAGADIKNMTECNSGQVRDFVFNKCYNKIMNLSVPTIASIDGYALGGGLELALCCDIRIAAESAKLGLPESNLGIMPGAGGTVRLPRRIGYAKACELIFTGAHINAAEAEKIGLVNLVVPKEELEPAVMKMCKKITAKSKSSLAVAKRTIKQTMSMNSIEEAVAYEEDEWVKLFDTADQKEGMRAFAEKRKPVFTGK